MSTTASPAALTTPYRGLLPPQSTDERDALRLRIETEGGVHDPVLLTESGEVLEAVEAAIGKLK